MGLERYVDDCMIRIVLDAEITDTVDDAIVGFGSALPWGNGFAAGYAAQAGATVPWSALAKTFAGKLGEESAEKVPVASEQGSAAWLDCR